MNVARSNIDSAISFTASIADAALPPDMLQFLEGGEHALARARAALTFAEAFRGDTAGRQLVFARNAVKLLSPLALTARPAPNRAVAPAQRRHRCSP